MKCEPARVKTARRVAQAGSELACLGQGERLMSALGVFRGLEWFEVRRSVGVGWGRWGEGGTSLCVSCLFFSVHETCCWIVPTDWQVMLGAMWLWKKRADKRVLHMAIGMRSFARDTSQLFTTAFPVVEWLVDCSCSEEKKENRPIKSLQWPTRAFKAEGKFQDGQHFCRCVCIDLPTTVILWCGCPKICINLRGWIILLIPLKQPEMQILSRARNLIQMFLYICFSGLSGVVINLTGFAWLQSCSESVDSKGQENSLHYSKSGSFASDYTLCYT